MVKKKSILGMTLMEVMLTTAILGVIFGIGPTIFLKVIRFYNLNRSRIEVQADSRILLDIMNRNLRQAQMDTITISRASGQPPYSKITFVKVQGDSMSFYQSNSKLIMQVNGTSHTLSSNLRYVAFTFPMSDDMSIISISMTMEKAIYEGKTKAMHLAVEKVRIMN